MGKKLTGQVKASILALSATGLFTEESQMNTLEMLHQMCHEVLSNADVKTICKSRGFSAKEAASRALFENFYLSDIGVETAIASLTKEEVVLLHLLRFIGEEVDVSLFARIYGDAKSGRQYYYRTFTQRYKEVFKQTRLSLVRKGVLLLAEDKHDLNADTKMERWRFRFPQEFERFLPPLVKRTTILEGDGDVRSDVRRRKLMEAAGHRAPSPTGGDKRYRLRLVAGELRMGDQTFRDRYLSEWQRACWELAVPFTQKKQGRQRGEALAPIQATTYVFDQLGEKEWLRPGQLSLPLRIFCDAHLDGVQICQAGWEWGCLARQEVDGVAHYRLPEKETEAEVEPERYLSTVAGQPLIVNLGTVPYTSLEYLTQICKMEVADSTQGFLSAIPDLIKMGNAMASTREQPLVQWLRKNAPPFHQALETVEQRWGKQIIHEDLLIAHIGDLGLKVQLERAFPDPKEVVFLPNDYIAFPRALSTAVQKVVTKSGHVIKTVQAND